MSLLREVKHEKFATLLVQNHEEKYLVGMHAHSHQLILPCLHGTKKEIKNLGTIRQRFRDELELVLSGELDHCATLSGIRVTKDNVKNVDNNLIRVDWNEELCKIPPPRSKSPIRWYIWLGLDELVELQTCPINRRLMSPYLLEAVEWLIE